MNPSMDWQKDANCRGLGTEFFFPGQGSRVSSQVRRICENCTVREECLAFSIRESGFEVGIWGGIGERVRERTLYTGARNAV